MPIALSFSLTNIWHFVCGIGVSSASASACGSLFESNTHLLTCEQGRYVCGKDTCAGLSYRVGKRVGEILYVKAKYVTMHHLD